MRGFVAGIARLSRAPDETLAADVISACEAELRLQEVKRMDAIDDALLERMAGIARRRRVTAASALAILYLAYVEAENVYRVLWGKAAGLRSSLIEKALTKIPPLSSGG